MFEHIDLVVYKLRFLFAGLVIVACLFLLGLLLSATVTAEGMDHPDHIQAVGMSDSPNAVTGGMSVAAYDLERTIDSLEYKLSGGLRSTGDILSQSGTYVGDGLHAGATFVVHGMNTGAGLVGKGVKNSALFMVHAIGNVFGFVGHTTGAILGFVSNAPVVSAVIKPAASTPMPVIDPASPTLFASKETVPPPAKVSAAGHTTPYDETAAAWPMVGEITTLFGVPHWPYQPTHTGIDISDGKASGVSAVKPFRPGRVIETVRSGYGLGNHVIVDHGGGMTSVYAHLSSISVRIGQEVDKAATLGYQGSTGASTGTHLHFEIRLNGQPVNPLPYVGSHP